MIYVWYALRRVFFFSFFSIFVFRQVLSSFIVHRMQMIFQVSVCVSVCPRARAPACLFSVVIKSFIISRASASLFFVFVFPLFVFVKSSSAVSFIPDRRLQPAAATVLLAFFFHLLLFTSSPFPSSPSSSCSSSFLYVLYVRRWYVSHVSR